MSGKVTFKQKLKYKFDNLMSAGTIALIGWLGIISFIVIIIAAIILTVTGFSQQESESLGFIEAAWESLMRTLDPGTMGQDTGWGYRLTMLGVTLGGIFVVSTLIGVLASGISTKLDELRKGHSFVVEKEHTLILGWSEKIFPIISELVIANENRKNACIVILANKDKVEMEEEIRSKIPYTKNTKVICRNGSTIDMTDLHIVNPDDARSVIILAPENDEPDIHVIKTILAITNNPERKGEPYHIVAEINDVKNKEAAEMVGNDELILIHSEDLISRVIAQTCRQSGLSIVYTELLDFEGAEIYFHVEPSLNGKTFKETMFAYEDSAVLGFMDEGGKVKINPPMDTIINEQSQIIAISEDDDTVKTSGKTEFDIDHSSIKSGSKLEQKVESTLIMGWNKKASSIIKELDNYVAKGSKLVIAADDPTVEKNLSEIKKEINNHEITFKEANTCDRKTLESLELDSYDHIIILCYSDRFSEEQADSKTLITLLHLRSIAEKTNSDFSIVSEMLDIRNKELAEITKADDFIISNKLISLMLSQLSENKHLKAVFDDLFNAEGSEIYLKPVSNYVSKDKEINFYTVLESASQKNEIAIGYRIAADSFDASKAYGVKVNPNKNDKVTFNSNDKIIVIAED